ncbi:hypothetical protein CkaCkLH20_12949 [Colletotrichum karsti]|uniref:Uncharacterized protein n=1 Tax=Colletotrichum karsti TaxID=1095194 RepID=A0A9P6HWH0_9PEZI|nr:uncharacterized protein CkaCkLH20_12949 [Colletotrichum karsti]KAF9869556.1 hypothetical protein CkaCkLH20_12949 [Colletotrichum karsti]
MCKGTETTMSCGHALRSRLQDCGKGSECKGAAWQPAFLNDSCAACHRSMNLRQNRTRYEAEQVVLMADYQKAKSEGDDGEMCRLRRVMVEHARLSRTGNFEVSLTREALPGHVQWPNVKGSSGNSR